MTIKELTTIILFVSMIVAGIAWIFRLENVYNISAIIMGITGIFYWFRYLFPELYNEKDSEFLDD